MNKAFLQKIYYSILNCMPYKVAHKLDLVIRCLAEDWEFPDNLYSFSSEFSTLETGEIRRRLNGLEQKSVALAEEYVRRCRNLEQMKGKPFAARGTSLIQIKALKNDIILAPETSPELKSFQKKYKFKIGAEVLIYQHGLAFYREEISSYIKNKVFIDAGACIGELIPALLEYAPEKIYAFEPSKKNISRFKKEMQNRNISSDKVEIVSAGLGDENCRMNFNDCGGGGQKITESEGNSQCDVIPLDEFAATQKIEKIGLIKADVEGMGLSLLHGAISVIQKDRPVLALAAYHNPDELLGQYEFLRSKLQNYYFELRDLPSGSCFEITLLVLPCEIKR